MNNISSKDRILRNQINLMKKEYDNISNTFYDSKMQYLLRNQPNNYNSNTFNYLNKNKSNYYNSHYNDQDLQSRITNSLYVNNNRKNKFKRNTPEFKF